VGIALLSFGGISQAEASVADTINFQGRLLAGPGTPAANRNFDIRFSIWPDADFDSGSDRDGGGQLVGAPWQEVVTMSTDSQGFFISEVGGSVGLPQFDGNLHRYLQVEVKPTGQPDTVFFLLDNKGADPTIDRKSLTNSAYAQNAARLDGKELGFGADQIPYLDANGKLDQSLITDDSWLDPVADTATMNALSAVSGDVVFVQSEGRLYTYNGVDWIKTGTDTDAALSGVEGRIDVAETNIATNAAAISSNADSIISIEDRTTQNELDITSNVSSQNFSVTSSHEMRETA